MTILRGQILIVGERYLVTTDDICPMVRWDDSTSECVWNPQIYRWPFITVTCVAALLLLLLVFTCIKMKRTKVKNESHDKIRAQNSRRSRLKTPILVRSNSDPYVNPLTPYYSSIRNSGVSVVQPIYFSFDEIQRASKVLYVNDDPQSTGTVF